jgi:hypothetical protein
MKHKNFILSPINDILEEVISASIGIGNGIETYPLCDYVMQSVFLKMTGAQEQKMKCICWELASNDYEYRYYRFTQNKLGECSNSKEKKEVYKDLVEQIMKHGSIKFDDININKLDILNKTESMIESAFSDTNLLIWAKKSFDEYTQIWGRISEDYFAKNEKNLFSNINNISGSVGISLEEMYDNHLYKHRNRVAHNTLSYQQNLPTLKALVQDDYKYNNYFIYFAILVLIDNIFIDLYKNYIQKLEEF